MCLMDIYSDNNGRLSAETWKVRINSRSDEQGVDSR